jgi:dCMP deaminase
MSKRWDDHFLKLCLAHAEMSKDPSTRVGAVITGPDREIISAGFNGFPRGIDDTPDRLMDRDTKLKLTVHGEMNAILAAARRGHPLKGCTMYMACRSNDGYTWGSAPCTRCTVEIIQAGITEVVSYGGTPVPLPWKEDVNFAEYLLEEAGVRFRSVF